MKKGQAALEFMMSYGWAILVVLAAVTTIAYFGIMSPDKNTPQVCMFNFGISCQDFHMGPDVAQFYLTNSLGKDITITNITAIDCTATFNTPLDNGQSSLFEVTSCSFGSVGEKKSGTIIVYYITADGLTKMHQGSIKGVIE